MVQQSLDFYPWLTSDEFTARRVLIQRLNDNFAELATTLSISITPYVLNNLRMYPEDEWNLEVIKWANEQMSLISAAAGITHVPIPVSVLTLETRDLFRHFHLEMEPKITEAYVAAFADKVPATFSFTDVSDAALDTQYESDAIVVAGIDAAAPLTITGGQYQIDGGSWASSPTTVVNGASIKVRATSSAEFDTAVDVVLTIGGVSDTFTILSVGEGGGGGYTAQAVHFDGATYLSASAPIGSDTALASFNVWLNFDTGNDAVIQNVINDNNDDDFDLLRRTLLFRGGFFPTPNNGNSVNWRASDSELTAGLWLRLSGMLDVTTGTRVSRFFLNGTEIGGGDISPGDGFLLGFGSYLLTVPGDGNAADPFFGSMADFWLAPGQLVDFSNPVTDAKFAVAGKPVGPGAGPNFYGLTAPALFFSGDGTTFATNQGTGGAFTLTGVLTNATTSPSA